MDCLYISGCFDFNLANTLAIFLEFILFSNQIHTTLNIQHNTFNTTKNRYNRRK